MVRSLLIMRHAQAESYAESDRERRLTERGVRDAANTGRWLESQGLIPDYALVSHATRAQQTWKHVREASGAQPVEEVSQALYAASPALVVEAVRLLHDRYETVIVVGHNPCAGDLLHRLDDQEGDPSVLQGVISGFPTAAVAVFEVPGPWAALGSGGCRLTGVHVGRG